MLRCLSGPNRPCKDSIIRVEVVDQCTDPCPANFLLSTAAFTAVSRLNDAKINVEFAQYVVADSSFLIFLVSPIH